MIRGSTLFLSASLALSPLAPAAAADTLFRDAGVLLGLRSYATGMMQYCYKHAAPEASYIDTAEQWMSRNESDSNILDAVLVSLNIDAGTQARMDKVVADRLAADFTAAADKVAFCGQVADAVGSGNNDLAVAYPDLMKEMRAAAAN